VPGSLIISCSSGESFDILSISVCGLSSDGTKMSDILRLLSGANKAREAGHSLSTLKAGPELKTPSMKAAPPLFGLTVFRFVAASVFDLPTRTDLPKFSAFRADASLGGSGLVWVRACVSGSAFVWASASGSESMSELMSPVGVEVAVASCVAVAVAVCGETHGLYSGRATLRRESQNSGPSTLFRGFWYTQLPTVP
jgi:hypothetical protein